ncbi:hypothetical protein [Streptomyces filamentosus]
MAQDTVTALVRGPLELPWQTHGHGVGGTWFAAAPDGELAK